MKMTGDESASAGVSITFEVDAWDNQCKQWSLLS